jgi:hypothetical protein
LCEAFSHSFHAFINFFLGDFAIFVFVGATNKTPMLFGDFIFGDVAILVFVEPIDEIAGTWWSTATAAGTVLCEYWANHQRGSQK